MSSHDPRRCARSVPWSAFLLYVLSERLACCNMDFLSVAESHTFLPMGPDGGHVAYVCSLGMLHSYVYLPMYALLLCLSDASLAEPLR